jgi:hypothetical protein
VDKIPVLEIMSMLISKNIKCSKNPLRCPLLMSQYESLDKSSCPRTFIKSRYAPYTFHFALFETTTFSAEIKARIFGENYTYYEQFARFLLCELTRYWFDGDSRRNYIVQRVSLSKAVAGSPFTAGEFEGIVCRRSWFNMYRNTGLCECRWKTHWKKCQKYIPLFLTFRMRGFVNYRRLRERSRLSECRIVTIGTEIVTIVIYDCDYRKTGLWAAVNFCSDTQNPVLR